MSTLKFNEDGALKVSEKIYEKYREYWSSNSNGFYDIIEFWTNHYADPDGFARLCLRDLLRQDYSRGRHTEYHFNNSYGNFLRNEDVDIYRLLLKSSIHRTEFVSEATYALENDLIPTEDESDWALLIELLVALGCAPGEWTIDIEYLWSLHPVNRSEDSLITQTWREFEFCQRGFCTGINTGNTNIRYDTANLVTAVKKHMNTTLSSYIKECNSIMATRGSVYSDRHPYDPRLIGYAEPPTTAEELIIRLAQLIKAFDDDRQSARTIELFEEHLDESVVYLDGARLCLLPGISDDYLAFRALKRHIKHLPDAELLKMSRNLLFWAIGLVTEFPKDYRFPETGHDVCAENDAIVRRLHNIYHKQRQK